MVKLKWGGALTQIGKVELEGASDRRLYSKLLFKSDINK